MIHLAKSKNPQTSRLVLHLVHGNGLVRGEALI